MQLLKKIYHSVMEIPRTLSYKKLRKKLKNSDFSIIASDCFGGLVYHNLGQKFNSPTINLSFPQNDFYQFVLHLKEYLDTELIEVEDNSVSYPVGSLTYHDQTVRINFMHYKSFEEAKNKWNERKQRINFSNLYIIQTVARGITQEYLDQFSALPYPNKLLITHNNDFQCECMVTHDIFSKKNYENGEILRYKSMLSTRRHMDDIDYVSFLNRS